MPHWQAGLARELVLENCVVAFPSLPERNTPRLSEWVRAITNICDTLNPDIVIAHSLGCIAWLHARKKCEKLFLVAPPSPWRTIEGLESFYPLNSFDTLAKNTLLITSDNDEYLSNDEALKFAELLGCEHLILQGGGHINALSGFGECGFIKNIL